MEQNLVLGARRKERLEKLAEEVKELERQFIWLLMLQKLKKWKP